MSPPASVITDSGVYCRAPYEAATLDADDEAVLLKVGQGDDMEEIWVAVKLLSDGSEYFADRLQGRDADMRHLPLGFPREAPAHFRVFVTFLETGTLSHPNLRSMTASSHVFRFLSELYAFAGSFDAHAFRNAVLDAVLLRIMSAPRDLPYENVQDVYEHTTSSSSLRDLVIDVVLHIGRSRDLSRKEDVLPKSFLVDCLKMADEDGIVPFQMTREWLEGKAERMCTEYHVHGREELRAAAMSEDDEMDEDEEENGGHGMEELGTTGHDEEEVMEEDGDELEVSEEVRQQMQNIEDLRKLRIHY